MSKLTFGAISEDQCGIQFDWEVECETLHFSRVTSITLVPQENEEQDKYIQISPLHGYKSNLVIRLSVTAITHPFFFLPFSQMVAIICIKFIFELRVICQSFCPNVNARIAQLCCYFS